MTPGMKKVATEWRTWMAACVGLWLAGSGPALAASSSDPSMVSSQFVVTNPRFPSCHASTLVETPEGLLAAWFGGSEEGAPDVGIWMSRLEGQDWSPPTEIATGTDPKRERRYPCWNPVLVLRRSGELLLFYKAGPHPSEWWGMMQSSSDNGRTWDKLRRLPTGIVGPVRNKPVELADGTLVCGASLEDKGWRVHMEWTRDPWRKWERGPNLNAAFTIAAIQPTILQYPDGTWQILCRSKQGRIMDAWSTTNATSYETLSRTLLPNPNSAIDGVVLTDGTALLVYNHLVEGRDRLNVAVSRDGKWWQAAAVLEHEPGCEFSYPAVIQTQDNLVHVTYTWKRKQIKHVVLDPARFQPRDFVNGRWPEGATAR